MFYVGLDLFWTDTVRSDYKDDEVDFISLEVDVQWGIKHLYSCTWKSWV